MRRTSQGMWRQYQSMARLCSPHILYQLNHNTMSHWIFTILPSTWSWPCITTRSPQSDLSCTRICSQHVIIRSPHFMNQATQKVTWRHQQSCRNTPSITLEEQGSIRTTISTKTLAQWIQARRLSTRSEFQSGERVRSEDETPISGTIRSSTTHSRRILHLERDGWHNFMSRSCSISTSTISRSRRHSNSHWRLTFGRPRWFT